MRYILVLLFIATTLTKVSAQTDTTIGLNTPGNFGTDYDAIAAALCIDLKTEHQKANAIYNWVTHNIAYDVNAMWQLNTGDDDKVTKALKTKKAICGGYAELYTTLCKSAGLSAITIEGYAKDFLFDNGDEIYIPRHAWNAVKIDGKWQLVDATWGAGAMHQQNSWLRQLLNKLLMQKKLKAKNLKFSFHYDPQYFAQDPKTFRLKHIPIDPLWQLTDTAMPLSIFEAGDSAVNAFNQISNLQQSSAELDKIATFSTVQKHFHLADRAYTYNQRYHVIIAYKNNILADTAIKTINEETQPKTADSLLKVATTNMKESLDYINKQKKHVPEEYMKLNRKNKTKSTEARQYMRQIKTDDKRLIAESKKRTKSSDNKNIRNSKKLRDIRNRKGALNPNQISKIETNKTPKKSGAPELDAIEDSITARNARIQIMAKDVAIKADSIKWKIKASAVLLDSLSNSLYQEDSMLRKEASARLSMHDSYDNEVKQWNDPFKKQKYFTTDTLMKYYFASFDTISLKFENLQKCYIALLNIYKSNLRSMEQYKKWNDGSTDLKNRYAEAVNEYTTIIDTAMQSGALYASYLKASKAIFLALQKAGKRQITIVEYMEKAEKSRQDLEARTLARKKHTDLKENEQQKKAVQNTIKVLGKATSGTK